MASQDAWAQPLAKQLVDLFRCSSLSFVRKSEGAYDPVTGTIASTETRINAAGAVLNSMTAEAAGVDEDVELTIWLDHQTVPWPIDATDRLEYMGRTWKIINIDPTYSGDVVYASKVKARAA